jgi:hypothetical protein
MIVARDGGRLRLVTQPDHAHLAAEILGLFRLPELATHPRRDRLLRAVRGHDDGWREADAAPRIDPATGRPFSFRDLPAGPRAEIYARGARRHEDDPYVQSLVIRHLRSLLRGREASPEWADLCADLADLGVAADEAAGLPATILDADFRWLTVADALSLALCERWREPFAVGGWKGLVDGVTLLLRPFTLAGSTRVTVACRQLSDRSFDGAADLGTALAECRWERCPLRLAPRD